MSKENSTIWKQEFTDAAKALTEPEMGLKLIATIDSREWPHITMISFNKAKTPSLVVWGQFIEGQSKKNVLINPKQGVFYMNAKMPFKFVQAKIELERIQKGGEDCEEFSRGQMLRYMTYTNVHTAYYNKVIAVTDIKPLGFIGIVKGFLVNLFAKGGVKAKNPENKLLEIGYEWFNQMDSVKAISYIDPSDGFPIIIPCLGLRAPDRSRLVFPLSQFSKELKQIPQGAHVAVYVVVTKGLELTNLHVNGIFTGFQRSRGFLYGIIEIEEVYNSMPPLNGVIYPELQIRQKITQFPKEIPVES